MLPSTDRGHGGSVHGQAPDGDQGGRAPAGDAAGGPDGGARGGPVGAVLAGGAGRRMGRPKATVTLDGRPLVAYPLAVLRRCLGEVAVVVKAGTELPPLPGAAVWVEPDRPRHPLAGIVHALRAARGRSIVVCAVDLPLVTDDLVGALAAADRPGVRAAVPRCQGRVQPLIALYRAGALEALAGAPADVSVIDAVLGLEPRILDWPDPAAFANVNSREDLRRVQELLRRRAAG